MYVVIAIIVFGVLIAVHELGHFAVAKACSVKVNEFSIGMGPCIFKKQGKETQYSLRLLPLGGFCAMEGEDEDSDDPRAFNNLVPWKKLLILIAGSFMNFLLGFLVVAIVYSGAVGFGGNRIEAFLDGCPYEGENALMVGDTVIEIDGERIYYANDISAMLSFSKDETVDITVLRDGEKVTLRDFTLKPVPLEIDGKIYKKYGFSLNYIEGNFKTRLDYSLYSTGNFVRMVRMGLADLFTGRAGLKDMSGVVGIVDTISTVGKNSATPGLAASNIAYLSAFIAVNLAVMNMLPLPALDGGRFLFTVLNAVSEKLFKKRIPRKVENYINIIGLGLLMLLMCYVMINDIVRIVNG